MVKEKTGWSYDSVSAFYQILANIYSLRMIKKSKLMQLEEIKPNSKVLYVGVGSGEDAIMAARKGASVTCIDISEKMINLTKKKFEKHGVKGNFICTDVTTYEQVDYYDYVIANYFLNNFSAETMKKMLKHLTNLIKPNGKLLIADFIVESDRKMGRILQNANFFIAVTFFWILRVAPLHKMQDYTSYFKEVNLQLSKKKYSKLFGVSIPLYGTITAVKNSN